MQTVLDGRYAADRSVVALGMFDGVHIGHQVLLKKGRALADRQGVPLVTCTFMDHPLQLIAPDKCPPMLTTFDERVRLMESLGVDVLYAMPFDRSVMDMPPEDYVGHLVRQFHPTAIADLSPELAEKLGVLEGDWVWFENPRGKCKQQVHIAPGLMPNLVRARHGWWFPEEEAAEPHLYGVFNCNANNLTTMGVYGPTHYGAPYKSTLCKCYPVTPENDCDVSSVITTEPLTGYHFTRYEGE